ncbi:VanZ family protein [Longirhabdus pacifica]|uniref:VanZ family protein n=1 Tax=Longirhabdus pacifica TaxID=2305227 RepID=UPI001008886A|nr:VanZ family protein [Longirhabdus pacifica]
MDKRMESYIRQIVKPLDCSEAEKEEMFDEMKDHLLLLQQEYEDKGFSQHEAILQAIQSFGNENEISKGINHSLSPYAKMIKIVTWTEFSLYAFVALFQLIFKRLLNMNGLRYFYIYPENKGYWDMAVWQHNMNLIPFKNTSTYILEYHRYNFDIVLNNTLGNILIFMPLGFFLPLLFAKYQKGSRVVLHSMLMSLSIEVLQLMLQIGRFDIDDVILNTMGAALGWVVIVLVIKIAGLMRKTNNNKKVTP